MENPEVWANWDQPSRASADKESPLTFKETTKKDSQVWSFDVWMWMNIVQCSYPLTLKGKGKVMETVLERRLTITLVLPWPWLTLDLLSLIMVMKTMLKGQLLSLKEQWSGGFYYGSLVLTKQKINVQKDDQKGWSPWLFGLGGKLRFQLSLYSSLPSLFHGHSWKDLHYERSQKAQDFMGSFPIAVPCVPKFIPWWFLFILILEPARWPRIPTYEPYALDFVKCMNKRTTCPDSKSRMKK